MKGKEKQFVFLDPTVAQARHNRVQFFLDDAECALLEAAAAVQGKKSGELAGTLFRKHILPGLGDELRRLRDLAQPRTPDGLEGNKRSAPNGPKSVPSTANASQPSEASGSSLSSPSSKAPSHE